MNPYKLNMEGYIAYASSLWKAMWLTSARHAQPHGLHPPFLETVWLMPIRSAKLDGSYSSKLASDVADLSFMWVAMWPI